MAVDVEMMTDQELLGSYKMWHYGMVEGFGGWLRPEQVKQRKVIKESGLRSDNYQLKGKHLCFYQFEAYALDRLGGDMLSGDFPNGS